MCVARTSRPDDRTVGRILRDADLQPHRQKMYLTSHDDEFRQKRDDVLHVYYDAPPGEHIICLDEEDGDAGLGAASVRGLAHGARPAGAARV